VEWTPPMSSSLPVTCLAAVASNTNNDTDTTRRK
jgi:hypothetical protein